MFRNSIFNLPGFRFAGIIRVVKYPRYADAARSSPVARLQLRSHGS